MDALQRDVADQAAAHCREWGRALEGLRLRYAELLNALALALADGDADCAALRAEAAGAARAARAAQARGDQLAAAEACAASEAARLRAALEAAEERAERAAAEAAGAAGPLRRRLEDAEAAVQRLEHDLAEELARCAREADEQQAEHERQLAAAEARAADLQQRLQFAERRARHYREGLEALQVPHRPPGEEAATQTDAVEAAVPTLPPAAVAADTPAAPTPASAAALPRRSRQNPVDPLVPLLRRAATAKASRGRQWTVKAFGQLLGDRALADAAADADGVPRLPLGRFFVDWHLNRYGLEELAEAAAVELLASARHHAAGGCGPAYWLCALTGVLRGAEAWEGAEQSSESEAEAEDEAAAEARSEAGAEAAANSGCRVAQAGQQEGPGAVTMAGAAAAGADSYAQHHDPAPSPSWTTPPPTQSPLPPPPPPPPPSPPPLARADLLASPQALRFFVFACCQVAWPSLPGALCPETEDAAPLVRASAALDAVRAAFRWLGEPPEAAAVFIATRLEAAAATPRGAAAPLLLPAGADNASDGDASGSESGGGSSEGSGYAEAGRRGTQSARSDPRSAPRAGGSPAASRRATGAATGRGSSAAAIAKPSGGQQLYSAWGLIDALMEHWTERALANAAALGALFRAGCGDDGRASKRELEALLPLVAGQGADLACIWRAAAAGAAVQSSDCGSRPHHGHRGRRRIGRLAFVTAARGQGLDAWLPDVAREARRLAAASAAAAATAAGTVAQGLGGTARPGTAGSGSSLAAAAGPLGTGSGRTSPTLGFRLTGGSRPATAASGGARSTGARRVATREAASAVFDHVASLLASSPSLQQRIQAALQHQPCADRTARPAAAEERLRHRAARFRALQEEGSDPAAAWFALRLLIADLDRAPAAPQPPGKAGGGPGLPAAEASTGAQGEGAAAAVAAEPSLAPVEGLQRQDGSTNPM
ncbi:hypothetical protein Rsub_05721 [Raphidocelis subcapitata]|uniref:Uncharacterized protein n=1 Tax=Raphidocelis subcapitata TaxID=307507 RepID=A0A2V0P5H1_9CHLO|nr:hypothetical protein Rsub_05721 [Raphidocelis subcapitata]|eukprot:GBF93110.1 hypothetical protein Rsub_05721 [Raphidocelis subcapitata]